VQFGVAEAVDHWARYRPLSIAASANGTQRTYAELNGYAAAIAAELGATTDQPRIAVAFGSKVRLLAAILGVLRAGRSVVLLNTGLPLEVIRVNLKDAAVTALLHDESQSHLAGLVPFALTAPEHSFPLSPLPSLAQRHPSDEWGVLFSSGTTGVPKGIERDHESMVTELVGWCLELGLTRQSRFYIGRPIYYTGGLVLTLATLLVGGAAILNEYREDSFDEAWADYQRTLEGTQIDFAFFIPDQLRRFLTAPGTQQARSARIVLTMGAPITGAEKQQVVTAFGCDIVESWGNSESLGTITDPEDVHVRPDSIGRPFVTDEMCVVDDHSQPLPPTVLGRLAGSESAGFVKYCNRPDATDLAKRNSLIISEDVGYADENGFYYVRGRQQDCVVLPDGSTTVLQELEDNVRTLPMVQDCCIVTTTSGSGELSFGVAVVLSTQQVHAGLSDAVRQKLPANVPAPQIRVVDTLPRLPSGKVDRLAVNRQFEHAD